MLKPYSKPIINRLELRPEERLASSCCPVVIFQDCNDSDGILACSKPQLATEIPGLSICENQFSGS